MKKLVFITLSFLLSFSVYSQTFYAPTKSKENVDSTTTFIYNVKAQDYKVYKSKSGAFYIWKKSKKTGRFYKYYLHKDIQVKMGRQYKN